MLKFEELENKTKKLDLEKKNIQGKINANKLNYENKKEELQNALDEKIKILVDANSLKLQSLKEALDKKNSILLKKQNVAKSEFVRLIGVITCAKMDGELSQEDHDKLLQKIK